MRKFTNSEVTRTVEEFNTNIKIINNCIEELIRHHEDMEVKVFVEKLEKYLHEKQQFIKQYMSFLYDINELQFGDIKEIIL